jgi:hypothetical protein
LWRSGLLKMMWPTAPSRRLMIRSVVICLS